MGQLVGVTEKASNTPGVIRFETNRNFSGMGHERFASVLDAINATPSAELARRLFSTGRVDRVHVYGNMVTVDLAKGYSSDGLADVVRNLYQYWKPGMVVPSFDDFVESAPESASAVGAVGGGADSALSEAAKRVPAELLERSRLALAKWKATHGG